MYQNSKGENQNVFILLSIDALGVFSIDYRPICWILPVLKRDLILFVYIILFVLL